MLARLLIATALLILLAGCTSSKPAGQDDYNEGFLAAPKCDAARHVDIQTPGDTPRYGNGLSNGLRAHGWTNITKDIGRDIIVVSADCVPTA